MPKLPNPCPCGWSGATEPWEIRQPSLELRYYEQGDLFLHFRKTHTCEIHPREETEEEENERKHLMEHIEEELTGGEEHDDANVVDEDERDARLRVIELNFEWLASTPYDMWCSDIDNERDRLLEEFCTATGKLRDELSDEEQRGFDDECFANIKQQWVNEGIWRGEWEDKPPRGSRWGHEHTSVGSYPEFEQSRPRAMFLRRVAQRMNARADFINQPSPPMAEIYSECSEEIRREWRGRCCWDESWGDIPGDRWKHEECLEEFITRGLGKAWRPTWKSDVLHSPYACQYVMLTQWVGRLPRRFYTGLPSFRDREN